MPTPAFVWSDAHGAGRQVVVLFHRRVRLDQVPARAELHLFADTRYRLTVNGVVAGYGPARFMPHAPEHDTVDCAPLLHVGDNDIVVTAVHHGAASFEAVPSSGGLIAWGAIAGDDLSTPGAWRCHAATAWDRATPCYSFAQGPIEIVDTRLLPRLDDAAAWRTPVAIAQPHWGALTPRSIPALTLTEDACARVDLVAALAPDQRFGARVDGPASAAGVVRRACYATFIHAPRAQELPIGLFWGPHWLNGEELPGDADALLGNRWNARARLRAGWNLLYGEPEVMIDGWPLMVSLPVAAGLRVGADPVDGCPETMRVSASLTAVELAALRARPPRGLDDLPTPPGGWTRIARGADMRSPSREAAWDRPGAVVAHLPHAETITLPAGDHVVVVDMGREFLGHALVDLDAPAGTVVDVANAERKRGDGMLDLFRTHWMCNEAERFVASGGRQRWEALNPRGGRWLQATVRRATAPVRLRVAVRSTRYPARCDGAFACSDPLQSWAWRIGVDTVATCMEDAYVDCPWRERGCYVGDLLAQYRATRAFTADDALMRRCLRLAAHGQHGDGQMNDPVPAWKTTPLHDYSLIWIIALHEHWIHAGDAGFVRALWPHVERVLGSAAWRAAESGLWLADGLHLFLDWAALDHAKRGESGPLNAFRAAALACAADLARAIGRDGDADRLAAEAQRVATALRARLWRDDHLADSPDDPGIGLHTTTLALAYGLIGGDDARRAADHVDRHIERNARLGADSMTAYFFHYLLQALYRHGRDAAAERAVRLHYGPLRDAGAWTLWETFSSTGAGPGSLCHGWSAAPTGSAALHVLGVRPQVAGEPDAILIAPAAHGITWARGRVPHRRGMIDVAWEVRGDALVVDVAAPAGVSVAIRPEGGLARLRVVRSRVDVGRPATAG
ncbi:MAG TPA: alpha-L-rhamnosidase C-terminal domain-containing protein [Planctomycetota bacterium]|nr:alpha-L-rhamnosidase C-terminal domain-containing protein [Planctomycetota bacterium]